MPCWFRVESAIWSGPAGFGLVEVEEVEGWLGLRGRVEDVEIGWERIGRVEGFEDEEVEEEMVEEEDAVVGSTTPAPATAAAAEGPAPAPIN